MSPHVSIIKYIRTYSSLQCFIQFFVLFHVTSMVKPVVLISPVPSPFLCSAVSRRSMLDSLPLIGEISWVRLISAARFPRVPSEGAFLVSHPLHVRTRRSFRSASSAVSRLRPRSRPRHPTGTAQESLDFPQPPPITSTTTPAPLCLSEASRLLDVRENRQLWKI